MMYKMFGLILCVAVIVEVCPGFSGSWFSHRTKRKACIPDDDFTCKSGQCISSLNMCDGTRDCFDGSDETPTVCNFILKCPINSFKCAYGACINMDKKCDRVQDCADGSDEYHEVCVDAGKLSGNCEENQFQCSSGQCIDDLNICDARKDCTDGSDETGLLCSKYIKSCPIKTFRCNYGACIEFNMKCDGTKDCPDGSDEDSAKCFPNDCGKANHKIFVEPKIYNGFQTYQGQYPWVVGIYKYFKGKLQNICGGTLINPNLVLTAAHCVYDEKNKSVFDVSEIKVGLGKYYRDWDAIENGSVKRDVREIIVSPYYEGNITQFSGDIALIDLISRVRSSDVIMPACIDWELKFQPKPGMIGILAGWGKTENHDISYELKAAHLPIIERRKCRETIPSEFQSYITHDKFCAGHTNGIGVGAGDSGSGLTFKGEDGLFRVFGIVSTGVNEPISYSAFTNVTNVEHFMWLRDNIQRLNEAHK